METLETIETLINPDMLMPLVEGYLMEWIQIPFSSGLFLGAALEMLAYGIFKAVSLINIKY